MYSSYGSGAGPQERVARLVAVPVELVLGELHQELEEAREAFAPHTELVDPGDHLELAVRAHDRGVEREQRRRLQIDAERDDVREQPAARGRAERRFGRLCRAERRAREIVVHPAAETGGAEQARPVEAARPAV